MAEGEFTPKQQRFIVEYPKDLNATAAAIRAGYSENAARQQGSFLLSNPDIYAATMLIVEKSQKKAILSVERLDEELARIGFGDIRKLYDDSGNLLPVNQWPDDVAATVASIEAVEEIEGRGDERRVTGTLKKLKVWDKVSALTLIAKRLGAINESKNVNVNLSLEVLVAASMKADPADEAKTIEHEEKK